MLILLVLLIFFAALGIPLAFAIGASCVTYILIYAPTFITMLPQRVWNGAYSELMIAMPLFMLAGELMNTGGITQRIINFCMELLRPVRGGLGEVNIVASMIFGGISGSSVADTSALGSILIPAIFSFACGNLTPLLTERLRICNGNASFSTVPTTSPYKPTNSFNRAVLKSLTGYSILKRSNT